MRVDEFEAGLCQDDAELNDYWYVSPAFNKWQSQVQGKRLQSFGVFRKDNKKLYARLTLAGQGKVWASPVTGTFGGVVLHKAVPVGALDMLMEHAVQWLKQEGAETCFVRLPPASFPDPTMAVMQNVLFRKGWVIDQMEINYHLPIVPVEEFHAQLGSTKRQETRRLKTSGAAFRLVPADEGQKVYNIIAANRAARGYPMTMTWEALAALTAAFPDRVRYFGVFRNDDLLSAAIGFQITPTYFYIFYWGESPDFRREMPVLALVDGLVDYCHKNGTKAMDIGISTEKSAPNEGLIEFKTGLGFLATPKLTYRYDLSDI